MKRTPAVIFVEALACVAREAPEAYARMRVAFGSRTAALAIAGDTMHVALDSAELAAPSVDVRASVDALCAILAGDVAVLDALLAREIEIAGAPDDLVATSEATTWFLEGAVRCLSMPLLTAELFSLRTEST